MLNLKARCGTDYSRAAWTSKGETPPTLVPLGLTRATVHKKLHFLIFLFSLPFIFFLAFFFTNLKPTTLIYPKNLKTPEP
jgi:hypothetical protein